MEKFYLYVAVPASLLLIIQSIMTFLGLSGDIDTDFDGDGDVEMTGETGLTLFSFRNLVAFFTFFGWSGLWLISLNVKAIWVVLISVLVGFVFMLISMSLFFLVSKMQRNGTINLMNAIGQKGNVYITIPAKRENYGKVMVVIQGALTEIEAITDDDETIKSGSSVEVIAVEGNRLIVRKI